MQHPLDYPFPGPAAFLFTSLFLIPAIPFLTGLTGTEYGLVNTYLPLALVIGAISVATAPGAILAIVSELRASGPFTSILLGIIALDDGLALIFFALASAAGQRHDQTSEIVNRPQVLPYGILI